MKHRLCVLVLLAALPMIPAGLSAQDNLLDSPDLWTLSDQAGSFAVEGGESVLRLANGGAELGGIEFGEGDISFEMKLTPRPAFVGILFRAEERNAEHIYFRPHRSGQWDAIQYQPIMNGSSTWQLYQGEGFSAPVELPRDAWIPVRIEVRESWAELYVGGAMEPTMNITLERGVTSGGISLNGGFRGDAPDGEIAISFRRFSVRAMDSMSNAQWSRPAAPDDAFIRTWSVSEPFAVSELPVTALPASAGSWIEVVAEPRGLVNLSRYFSRLQGAFRSAVVSVATINSRSAVQVPLDFDYSDEVSVFLNDELLFSGVNSWESRYPFYLGGLWPGALTNRVWLNLREGENQLTFLVSERAFGWGFVASMERPQGVVVGATD